MFEAEAKERQRLAGGDHGNQYTGGQVAVGEILPQAVDRNPKATDQAAAAVGVSGKYVSDIKAISKKAPELL